MSTSNSNASLNEASESSSSDFRLSAPSKSNQNFLPLAQTYQAPFRFKDSNEKLSPEEASFMISQWEANHFRDFNTWCQKAHATVKLSFESIKFETGGGFPINRLKNELCTLSLTIHKQEISVKALGPNKKEAKRNAVKMIVSNLISNGIICLGLKDKENLNKSISLPTKSDPTSDNEAAFKDKKQLKMLKKNAEKFTNKIQVCLKSNDFKGACMALCNLSEMKSVQWKEVCNIWSFALIQRKIDLIKSILDLINYKEISHNKMPVPNSKDSKKIDEINQILFNKYSFVRLYNKNAFEVYDYENTLALESEIHNENNGNPNNFLQNPNNLYNYLYNDITESFGEPLVINTTKIDYSKNKKPETGMNMDQPTTIINEINTNFLYNTNIYLNQYFDNNSFSTMINSEKPHVLNVNSIDNSSQINKKRTFLETDFNKSNDFAPINKKMKNIDFSNNNIMINHNTNDNINNFNNINQKNNSPSALIDPNRYYHSYKLLNSLYDSLLLVGDFNLALQISEILYSTIHINPKDFCSFEACEYYKHQKNLQFIQDLENIYFVSPKKKQSLTLTNCILIVEKMAKQIFMFTPVFNNLSPLDYFDFNNGNCIENQEKFNKGDYVVIFSSRGLDPQEEFSFIAKIIEIDSDFRVSFEALLNNELLKLLGEDKKAWYMSKLGGSRLSDKISQNLVKFCCGNSCFFGITNTICNASRTEEPVIQNNLSFELELTKKTMKNHLNLSLNHEQTIALNHAIGKAFTLIDGPKNSGKTTCAIEIMMEWLSRDQSQILYCTNNTNNFLLIQEKLQSQGVLSITMENYRNVFGFMANGPNTMHFEAKKIKILEKTMKKSRVILCTPLEISSRMFKNSSFNRVILDDANAIEENMAISALTSHCQKIVLLGDSQETVFFTNKIISVSKGYNISLFHRLLSKGNFAIKLKEQFFVEPSIVNFVNQLFLKDYYTSFQQDNSIDLWLYGLKWPNISSRILFINVKGKENVCNGSLENLEEVKIILGILSLCMKFNYIKSSDIGIISMYEQQKNKIVEEIFSASHKAPFLMKIAQEILIQRRNLINVTPSFYCEIETQDTFKAKEKDLVIFSTVRSNPEKKLGCLKDERKIYNIIKKAKKGLIILGDSETLNANEFWKKIINNCSGLSISRF